MTDDLMDDIIWTLGARMPWFDTRLGHLKKEKIYILYMFYISSILYICIIYLICIYISYILHIYVRSKCVIYK